MHTHLQSCALQENISPFTTIKYQFVNMVIYKVIYIYCCLQSYIYCWKYKNSPIMNFTS